MSFIFFLPSFSLVPPWPVESVEAPEPVELAAEDPLPPPPKEGPTSAGEESAVMRKMIEM